MVIHQTLNFLAKGVHQKKPAISTRESPAQACFLGTAVSLRKQYRIALAKQVIQ